MTELGADGIRVTIVAGYLATVMGSDAVSGELEGSERLCIGSSCGDGSVDLGGRDTKTNLHEIQAVEFLRQLDDRSITARADVGDDAANHGIDILRHLAFGAEEVLEASCEIDVGGGKAYGHLMAFGISAATDCRLTVSDLCIGTEIGSRKAVGPPTKACSMSALYPRP